MRIQSPSQIIKLKRTQRPKTYFELVDKVGSEGNYQFRILIIFLLVWFFIGTTLVNIKFLFEGTIFSCHQYGLLTSNCQQTICQLPQQNRAKYLRKQRNSLKSMILELSEYYCDDKVYVTFSNLSFPVGILIGFAGFSYFSDNFGRRISILVSLGFCGLGNLLLSISTNLILASLGLLLSGIGASSSLIITVFFFNEFTSNHKRQKYTVSVTLALTFGTIAVTSFYYLIPHWRIITIVLVTIPSLISLFLVFLYVEETPQFLLRKSYQEGLKSLNRIGNLNYKIKQILQEEDILAVKETQVVLKQFDEMRVNHSSLLRFGSLKFKLLDCCVVCFAIYFIYSGSEEVIGTFQFDIYSRNFILQLTELVVLILVWLQIEKINRKLIGFSVFIVSLFISAILMFLVVPIKCDQCYQNTIKFILIIIIRATIAFYLCVFILYLNELFPIRVSALTVGTVSAFGSLASILSQQFFSKLDINLLFFIFCGLSFIAACLTTLLPEAKKQTIKVDIQEVQILKNEKKSQLSGRNSFVKYSFVKSIAKN